MKKEYYKMNEERITQIVDLLRQNKIITVINLLSTEVTGYNSVIPTIVTKPNYNQPIISKSIDNKNNREKLIKKGRKQYYKDRSYYDDNKSLELVKKTLVEYPQLSSKEIADMLDNIVSWQVVAGIKGGMIKKNIKNKKL
jgi:hypothetical protein